MNKLISQKQEFKEKKKLAPTYYVVKTNTKPTFLEGPYLIVGGMNSNVPLPTLRSCPTDKVIEVCELVKATTTMAGTVIGEWASVRQGLSNLQETVDQFNIPLEQDEKLVQLPLGAAISIKDISVSQAGLAASAADVLENLDIQIPDFSEYINALMASAEKVRNRAREIDQRYKDLLLPLEKYSHLRAGQ